jgi:hypothetical protein
MTAQAPPSGSLATLWQGAVVVLSGVANPERAQLRQMVRARGERFGTHQSNRPSGC